MSRCIRDNMVRNPYVVDPRKPVKEALGIAKELDIRHLPVVDEEDKLVGVVSERDLREACMAVDHGSLIVEDIMKTDVHVANPDTPLREAVHVMADEKLGCTVVVNKRSEVVGIFTTTDALYMLCDFIEDETIGTIFSEEEFRVPVFSGV